MTRGGVQIIYQILLFKKFPFKNILVTCFIHIQLPLNSKRIMNFSCYSSITKANIIKLALVEKYNKIFNISYI